MSVDLSIVIVNWNTRDLLAQCLGSVASQHEVPKPNGVELAVNSGQSAVTERQASSTTNCSPFAETIVVDNASNDGSAAMVQQEFPWVRLIENAENAGFAWANNQAIRQTTGRYVLLLNSDTEVLPDALQSLITFGDEHPMAGIVGTRLVNPDGSFQAGPNAFPTLASVVLESRGIIQRLTRNPYFPSFPPEHSQSPLRCDWVGGACLLARRTAVDQVGFLDESFFMNSEEVDWCYRMQQHGWEVWYTPAASVVHLGGASAKRSTAAQRLRAYQGKALFLTKHHGMLAGRLAQIHFRMASFLKALAYGAQFLVSRNLRCRDYAAAHWAVAQEANWSQGS